MFYPPFLKQGDTIGICAPSSGIGDDLESYEKSVEKLRKAGFQIKETKSVRNASEPSASGEVRGNEFNALMADSEVKLILAASGGEYNFEMLPFIDPDLIRKFPKWVMGYSDPTFLTYFITCKFDIASLYGKNSKFMDFPIKHSSIDDTISLMKGNLVTQYSYDRYEATRDFENNGCHLDGIVNWELYQATSLDVSGRMIGGCADVIANMIGTPYDCTLDFVNRYEDIIWYFDVFSYSANALYLLMLQMKYCGYFEHAKAIIFGRILFKGDSVDEDYRVLLSKVFDIPFIMNADIGHVRPTMTLINGAVARITCENGKGSISFENE